MKQLNFVKIQAQGNDYLFFDFRGKTFPLINLEKLAKSISDRHFGVGSDGIVLILDDASNDAFMRIFNADGSEAKMCGSALRCVTAYLHEQNSSQKDFQINTLAGEKTGSVLPDGKIKVNLGKPQFLEETEFNGLIFSKIDIGNPHCVCFQENMPVDLAKSCGKVLEDNFKANIEFVEVISPTKINLQVWERGSGITLACGTGSGASVFAGIRKKLLANKVNVILPGGEVEVEYKDENIFLIGKVTKVFEGTWEI